MNPVLFKIGIINFYTHGFFMVLAMLMAGWVIYHLARIKRRKTEAIFDLVVFSLLTGVIAARITYFVTYRDQFESWVEIFQIWQGGLVSWGGFAAGMAVYLLIVKLYREPVGFWLDVLGVAGLLGISIGRLGSFLSGEYAGKTTSLPWSFAGVHPVTLYESVILLTFFFLFLSLYLKNKIAREGMYFLLVMLVYSLVRFGLEFLRVDPSYWLGMTLTQITSSIIVLAIIIYLIIISVRKRSRYA